MAGSGLAGYGAALLAAPNLLTGATAYVVGNCLLCSLIGSATALPNQSAQTAQVTDWEDLGSIGMPKTRLATPTGYLQPTPELLDEESVMLDFEIRGKQPRTPLEPGEWTDFVAPTLQPRSCIQVYPAIEVQSSSISLVACAKHQTGIAQFT